MGYERMGGGRQGCELWEGAGEGITSGWPVRVVREGERYRRAAGKRQGGRAGAAGRAGRPALQQLPRVLREARGRCAQVCSHAHVAGAHLESVAPRLAPSRSSVSSADTEPRTAHQCRAVCPV